jgi:uncharacterized protein DUF4129
MSTTVAAPAARLRWRLVACLMLAVVASVASIGWGDAPAYAAETVPMAGYLRRIDAARDQALEGRRSPSPDRMQQVRDRLGLPLAVAMADGQRIELPADEVLEGLDGGRAADFDTAARHLAELSAAASRVPAVPALDRQRIPGALRSAYRGVAARPTILQRLGAWVGFQLSRLWHFLTRGPVRPSVLWTLVRILAVGATVVLIVYVGVRLIRQIGLVPAKDQGVRRGVANRVDWARAAEEALDRGEVREAVRALYRLLVEILTERALVPDLASLTPAECRIAVRKRSAQRPASEGPAGDLLGAIDRATSAFERVVYGCGVASAADVEALRGALRAAERMARAA